MLASCNGMECEGEDFEQKSCSREVELAERVAELESDLEECQGEYRQTSMSNSIVDKVILFS